MLFCAALLPVQLYDQEEVKRMEENWRRAYKVGGNLVESPPDGSGVRDEIEPGAGDHEGGKLCLCIMGV